MDFMSESDTQNIAEDKIERERDAICCVDSSSIYVPRLTDRFPWSQMIRAIYEAQT